MGSTCQEFAAVSSPPAPLIGLRQGDEDVAAVQSLTANAAQQPQHQSQAGYMK